MSLAMHTNSDTICAISTPAGNGAIAIVRISGRDAFPIAESIFRIGVNGKPGNLTGKRGLKHGWIMDTDSVIDEVMICYYRGPHSYTGEDLIEINCHGSTFIQGEILKLLVRTGSRIAQPGEFTQRAFLNGKMDLAQSEAVADLISASGAAAHRLAMDQIRGGFSRELSRIREKLLEFVTLIELELDFSEEDVEFADRSRLRNLTSEILERIDKLVTSFELGNAIKSGVPVAITGATNVGKSTLLNLLLREERAIVSEIAGTTRDTIEDTIRLGGIDFRFIDTAGIRETSDQIEVLGIERTHRQIQKSTIVLLVVDPVSDHLSTLNWISEVQERIRENQHLIVVINKADLDEAGATLLLQDAEKLTGGQVPVMVLSAKTGLGLQKLEELLLKQVNLKQIQDSDVVVTNIRHFEALTLSAKALKRASDGMNSGVTADFLSQDIREAIHFLGEITGQISNDEILENIFRNFCIGK